MNVWNLRAGDPGSQALELLGPSLVWSDPYQAAGPSRTTLKAPQPRLGSFQWLCLVTLVFGVLAWAWSPHLDAAPHWPIFISLCVLLLFCWKSLQRAPRLTGLFYNRVIGGRRGGGRKAGMLACEKEAGDPRRWQPLLTCLFSLRASLMPPPD